MQKRTLCNLKQLNILLTQTSLRVLISVVLGAGEPSLSVFRALRARATCHMRSAPCVSHRALLPAWLPDVKVMPMVAPSPVCAGVLGQTVTGMVCDGSQPRRAGLRAPGAVPTPSAETEPAVRTIKLPCFLTKLAYLLFLGI